MLSWIFFAVQNVTWKWLHVSHAWDLVALLRKTFVVITGLEGRLFCHNIFTIHCTNSMIISNHCRQQYFWSQKVAFSLYLAWSVVTFDAWNVIDHIKCSLACVHSTQIQNIRMYIGVTQSQNYMILWNPVLLSQVSLKWIIGSLH